MGEEECTVILFLILIQVEDVMNVFLYLKVCGYKDEDINIDIVPLFETMEGLAIQKKVMQGFIQ